MSATALGRVAIMVDMEGNAEHGLEGVSQQLRRMPGQAGGATEAVSGRFSAMFSNIQGGLGSLIEQASNPIEGLLGGALGALGLHALIDVNNEFDNTRRALAGTLETVGLATGGWENALSAANTQMTRIQSAAAMLPGEADDYIHAFQGAVPQLQAAAGFMADFKDETGHAYTGMSGLNDTLSHMTDFTNQFMAVAIGKGVDTFSAAQFIPRALSQARGAIDQQSVAWQRLGPYIGVAAQHMGRTVQNAGDFNKLSLEMRTRILQAAITGEGLRNVITDASTSWDAQMGTLTTISKTMLRMATSPFFHLFSSGLGYINGLVMNTDGSFTDLGKTIQTMTELATYAGIAWGILSIAMSPMTWTVLAVAAGFYALAKGVQYVRENWDEISQHPIIQKLKLFYDRIVGTVQYVRENWDEISQHPIIQKLKLFYDRIVGTVTGIREIFSTLSGETGTLSDETYNNLQELGILDFVVNLSAVLYRVWSYLEGLWDGLSAGFTEIWNGLEPIVEAMMDAMGMDTGLLDSLAGTDPEAWATAGQKIGRAVAFLFQMLLAPFEAAFQFGEWIAETKQSLDEFIAAVVLTGIQIYNSLAGSWIGDGIRGVWNGIVSVFNSVMGPLKAVAAIGAVIGQALGEDLQFAMSGFEIYFKTNILPMWNTLKTAVEAVVNGISRVWNIPGSANMIAAAMPGGTGPLVTAGTSAMQAAGAVGQQFNRNLAGIHGAAGGQPVINIPPYIPPPFRLQVDGRVLAEVVTAAQQQQGQRLGV